MRFCLHFDTKRKEWVLYNNTMLQFDANETHTHSVNENLHLQTRTCTMSVLESAGDRSSGSSGRVRGGQENMKSMWPPLVAIFFMTYFHRAGGPPSAPLDPLLDRIMLYCLSG